MALTHSDHKRIASTIAQELKRVLSDANGQRVLAKHQARIGPKAPPPLADPAMPNGSEDDILEEMALSDAGEGPRAEGVEDLTAGRKKVSPFSKGGSSFKGKPHRMG
jgi:hypothetical protein